MSHVTWRLFFAVYFYFLQLNCLCYSFIINKSKSSIPTVLIWTQNYYALLFRNIISNWDATIRIAGMILSLLRVLWVNMYVIYWVLNYAVVCRLMRYFIAWQSKFILTSIKLSLKRSVFHYCINQINQWFLAVVVMQFFFHPVWYFKVVKMCILHSI